MPQQLDDDCGPAALASLLGHRGRQVDPAEIRATVYDPRLGGSLLPDLENFAKSRGFSTRSGRGDLRLLRQQVDAGRPVLLPIDAGFGPLARPHYLVVFGYGDAGFLAHAGVAAGRFFPSEDFDRRWGAMNYLYLLLE
ncbi:cysteine peptidase family C39 domain-containing protein [Desulfuromonas versatilis]|uniref:cysteine peptidase family C39 domain-containing protein n=1 Tax=Desulfuromonas versatilis TaxID=2802975 RepID=UPI001C85A649|nr:cysteine peptidase family C39 domain-containing protein [Desulfuromonas versatilis]